MLKCLARGIVLTCAVSLVVSGCGSDSAQDGGAPAEVAEQTSAISVDETQEVSSDEPSAPEGADGSEAEDEDVAPEAAGEPSFSDGVLTTPEVKIEITEHRVIPAGEEGNEYGDKPIIAFWYETTNLTDDEVDPLIWIGYFTAYQDNNPNSLNELEVAGLPDDRFLDSQTETIKKGGTVENAMAYELDDDTTPVDLVATRSDELGTTTYPLP